MFNGKNKRPARNNAEEANSSDAEPMSTAGSTRSGTPNVASNREHTTTREATSWPVPERRQQSSRTFDPSQEESFSNSSLKRAKYTNPATVKYIKKMNWEKMPDTTCKQFRKIMMDSYSRTLDEIAGSTPDNTSKDLEDCLKSIAREINQNVKKLMVPGHVDINLLNPNIAQLNEQLKEQAETVKRQLAHKSLAKEKQEERLLKNAEEVKSLQAKYLEMAEKLATNPIQKKDKSQDYVQSLMLNPSSIAFEN